MTTHDPRPPMVGNRFGPVSHLRPAVTLSDIQWERVRRVMFLANTAQDDHIATQIERQVQETRLAHHNREAAR